MKVKISRHKKHQEIVSTIFYPLFFAIHYITSLSRKLFRLEGLIYGIQRAKHRSKIGSLGAYSDLSPDIVIKHPKGLFIGERSSIGHGGFIDAGGGIDIGNYVMISHMVSLNSLTHPTSPPYHSIIRAKTSIRDHVWIGANTVIMEGVEIGEGSIVGAGSVVTKSVEPYTIVGGVPARVIRKIVAPMKDE